MSLKKLPYILVNKPELYDCTVVHQMVPLCVMNQVLVTPGLEYKILEYQKYRTHIS